MEGRSQTPSVIDSMVMIDTVDSAMKVAHDILSTLEAASADLAASQHYVKKYILLKAEQLARIANRTDFVKMDDAEDVEEEDGEDDIEDEDDESEQIPKDENTTEWHDRRSGHVPSSVTRQFSLISALSSTPQSLSFLESRNETQNIFQRVPFHGSLNPGLAHCITRTPKSAHRPPVLVQKLPLNSYLSRESTATHQKTGQPKQTLKSTGTTSSSKPEKKTIISKFLRCSVSSTTRPQKEKRRKVESGMLQVVLPPLFMKDMPRFMQPPFPRPPARLYTPPHVIRSSVPVSALANRNNASIVHLAGLPFIPLPSKLPVNHSFLCNMPCTSANAVSASSLLGKKRVRDAEDEEDASPRPRKEQRLSDSAPSNPCREVVLFKGPPSPPPSPPRRRPLPLPKLHHNHHLFVSTPPGPTSISPSQKEIEERRKYLKLRALGMLPLNPIPQLKVGSRSGKRPQCSDKHPYMKSLLIREYLCNRRNLPGNLAIRSSPVSSLVRSSFTRDDVDVESEPEGGYRIGPDPFSITNRFKWQSPLSFDEEDDD